MIYKNIVVFVFLFTICLFVFGANLFVHFIDIGQGDATLIQTPSGKTILVDAGPIEATPALLQYLEETGIREIDIVIATHPHADHIGGFPVILEKYPVGHCYMPRVSATSVTYRDLLLAIQREGLTIHTAKKGILLDIEEGFTLRFLSPAKDSYTEINNFSVVLLLEYGEISFLLMGDAEEPVEKELLEYRLVTQTDVLKAGHHGSQSSSSEAFIEVVKPQYAVIFCGAGNPYGRPHEDTLSTLSKYATVFRTDTNGTIVFQTDGKTLKITPSSPQITETSLLALYPYVGNKKTKVFHRNTCSSLPEEKNRIYFSWAIQALFAGYRPCKHCRPLALGFLIR
jgi:competence protein ComEC